MATDQEISHGRDVTCALRALEAPQHIRVGWVGTSWIMEVAATGIRDGKPSQAQHLFLSSLSTTPEAQLQLVRVDGALRAGTTSGIPSSTRTPTATSAMARGWWPRCAPPP
jgi:hypothetical protein